MNHQNLEQLRLIAWKWMNFQWTGDECVSKLVTFLGEFDISEEELADG